MLTHNQDQSHRTGRRPIEIDMVFVRQKFFVDGWSTHQIADALHLNRGTIENKLKQENGGVMPERPKDSRLPIFTNGQEIWECTKCHRWLAKSKFVKDSQAYYGIKTWCKDCFCESQPPTIPKTQYEHEMKAIAGFRPYAEDKAHIALELAKWASGPQCALCGAPAWVLAETGRYECSGCRSRKRFTIKTGTMMERSTLPIGIVLSVTEMIDGSLNLNPTRIAKRFNLSWYGAYRIWDILHADQHFRLMAMAALEFLTNEDQVELAVVKRQAARKSIPDSKTITFEAMEWKNPELPGWDEWHDPVVTHSITDKQRLIRDWVHEEVQRLSDRERKVIEGIYYGGHPIDVVGHTLGISGYEVTQIQRNAEEKLRSKLQVLRAGAS